MHPIIQEYCRLVPFLAQVLGDHTEVLVHDLSNLDASVVAIANGHVSGRKVGSPMNENGLRLIRSRAHEREEMYIRYRGVSRKKPKLLCSTKFILDEEGRLIGMLCLNYDFERDQLLLSQLAHTMGLADIPEVGASANYKTSAEKFPDSMQDVITAILNETISRIRVPVERLSQEEKIRVVGMLEARGVFLFKSAVSEVAKGLQTSEATIYRYLSKINKGEG